MLLAQQQDLIATLPSRAARLRADSPKLVLKPPPFDIPPFDLKMAWSPLLQHNSGHQWLRNLISDVAECQIS
jgi:DNA-binding transcriptional LysR family regulator